MSLALIVYLINVIPGIGFLAFVLGFCCVVAAGLSIFWIVSVLDSYMNTNSAECKQELKRPKKFIKNLLTSAIGLFFVAIVIPSEKTLYTMLAAYGVEKVATNEKTQEILGNGVDILNLQLQKYKEELLKEKSK